MKVFIGADHRGFQVKQALISYLQDQGHEVVDVGAHQYEQEDDFVDFAHAVANEVVTSHGRGILLCGSGVGMGIAANKVAGVRCGLGHTVDEVIAARNDDDINILALSSDHTTEPVMKELLDAFIKTPFAAEERFIRRLKKIEELEQHA